MTGTISSTGVGSGLDVNSIVTSLMGVEKRPLTLLQAQATTMQTKMSAFGSLKGQLANLGDVAAKLATASTWSPMQADSSDAASVAASAGSTAAVGAHSIEVQQLAQAQVLASGSFASSATAVGTGTLKLELGTTAAGVFTPATGSSPVSIAITSTNNTLAGVRDAINAAGAGVTASIVNGTGGARLVLRGADGGASSMRLTATDDDGNSTDTAGLSALAWDPAAGSGAGRNLAQSQAAQDAQYTIDGVALSSATNTTSDGLEGVTLTLKQVTTQPVTVGLSVQAAQVRQTVDSFVGAYNALNSLLKQQTAADPSGNNNGALQSDSTAMAVLNQLRSMLHGSVNGMSGTTNSLNAAGIVLQQDGSLAVDNTRFAAALKNPTALGQLFTQPQSGSDTASAGFAVRFKTWAQALGGSAGTLAGRIDSLQHNTTDNQKRQDREQDRLTATEARLRAQYQQLDTRMSALNAEMARMKSALGLT